MTKKTLRISMGLVLLLVVVGVLGALAFVLLRGYRGRGALVRAEQAYTEGRWREAKTNYTWYLVRHPGDPEVLPRYIESCLKLLDDRQGVVRDAGRGYLQLALAARSDRDLARQVIDFHKRHSLWWELDYAAGMLLREHPDDQLLSFNKALANDKLGRTAQALTAYQGLVDSGNAEPQTYGNLALLLERQDRRAQGWQVLEDALAAQPEDPRIRVERARFLVAVNELTQAAQEIQIALDAGLETGEAFLAAASVHGAQKDWEMVRAFAEKAAEKLPESAQVHLLVVQSYLANRQVDEAIAFLAAMDPYVIADNPQLYLLLMELQVDAGLLEEVDRTVESYRRAYPSNREVFEYIAARKLLKEGLPADAASKLEIVVEQAPELRIARYFLGLAYLESGQRERAKNTLELYINSNPGDERARLVWDATFVERSAIEVETQARELLDSDAPYFGSLFSSAHSLTRERPGTDGGGKRIELAKRLFERAIEQSPSTPEGYRDLAFLCLDQGDLESIRQVLARAEAAGIAASELNLLRSARALAESNLDQAKAYFDDELALRAITPQRAMLWAECFAGQGHLETGLELLQAVRAQQLTEEDRRVLDLGQVLLCRRAGDFERAGTFIESLAEEYQDEPAMDRRLNDHRMAIARALLAPGDRQDKPTAALLIAGVERIEPDRTDAKVLHARMLLEQDPADVDGADELCEAARKVGASDVELFLISGEVAYRKGQFAKALDYAVKANGVSPDDLNTGIVLARTQLQTGRVTDAVVTLEDVRTLSPENRTTLDLLARAYAGVGRFREAEELAQQLEALQGGQVAVSLRAWLLVARGEWAGAEQLLRSMHEANLDDLWTIHFLAVAMAGQGQLDRVESFLNECVARRPELPDLWVELGNSYLADADPARVSEASFAFTQALVRRTGYYRALLGLLEVQLRSENLGAALGLCDRLLAERPDDTGMLERKASLLAQLPGRQQEALDTIQSAIDLSPRPSFFYQRGCLRLDLGDYANAIEDFQRAKQAGGAGPGSLDLLMAEAYLGLNNIDLARVYYESAKNKASGVKPADAIRLDAIASRLAEEQSK